MVKYWTTIGLTSSVWQSGYSCKWLIEQSSHWEPLRVWPDKLHQTWKCLAGWWMHPNSHTRLRIWEPSELCLGEFFVELSKSSVHLIWRVEAIITDDKKVRLCLTLSVLLDLLRIQSAQTQNYKEEKILEIQLDDSSNLHIYVKASELGYRFRCCLTFDRIKKLFSNSSSFPVQAGLPTYWRPTTC